MSAAEKQQAVSMPLIIVLILVLAAAGYYFFFMGDDNTVQNNQPLPDTTEISQSEEVAEAEGDTAVVEGEGEESLLEQVSSAIFGDSNRNPFASPAVVKASEQKSKASTISIGPSTSTAPVVAPPPARPMWKGIVGTDSDRLAIVTYKNRTYFLRQGNRMGNTAYRLTTLNDNYVVLSSSDGDITLNREKEAGKK